MDKNSTCEKKKGRVYLMKKEKIFVLILGSLISVSIILLSYTSTTAQEALPSVIRWPTLAVGTANYLEAVGMAEMVKKYTPMAAKVEPTTGDRVWVPMLGSKEADVANQASVAPTWAYLGLGDWNGVKQNFLRVILEGSAFRFAMVTTKVSGIKTIADLRGKTVGFDAATIFAQTIWLAALEANGITTRDFKKIDMVTADMTKALIDGKIDAICWGMAPFLLEVGASAKGVFVIPLTPKEQANIEKRCPGAVAVTSPAGLYNQPATPLVGGPMNLCTYADQKENVVYNIVKAVYDHPAELSTFAPTLSGCVLSNFNQSTIVPYHTGAIKYYKEKGVWSNEMEKIQQAAIARGK
jgi:uncharacterized protein